jgi:hypothetical protein
LGSKLRADLRLPLAVTCALLAAMTRLSALPFALPIILYAVVVQPRTMLNYAAHLLHLSLLGIVVFILPNREAITWNVWTHHLGQWGDTPAWHKLMQIVGWRLPSLLLFFSPYVALAVYMLRYTRRTMPWHAYLRRHAWLAAFMSAVILFVVSHLMTGGWHLDYLVPAVTALLPLLAVGLSHLCDQVPQHSPAMRWLQRAFGATLLYSVVTGVYFVDVSGGQRPLTEIDEVAACVATHAQPSDHVLVLEALWVAVEANRLTLSGLSMAQFGSVGLC